MQTVEIESLTLKSSCLKVNPRDGKYHVAYWCKSAGRMVYRATGTCDLKEAIRQAKNVDKQLAQGNPMLTHPDQRQPVREAMVQAIRHSGAQDGQRRNLQDYAGYFLDYLEGAHPHVAWWHQVDMALVWLYIDAIKARGLKRKTARHYCSVISLTSRHLHRHSPKLHDVLEIVHPWLDEKAEPAKEYLRAEQLFRLLDLAESSRSKPALAAVIFGGFAGLNLKEIALLTHADVSTAACSVTVRKSKNDYRPRTIPVLPMVIDLYRKHLAGHLKDDDRIVGVADATEKTLSRAMRNNAGKRVLKDGTVRIDRKGLLVRAANVFRDDSFSRVDAKDMRKTWCNLCVQAGVTAEAGATYMGQSTTTNQAWNASGSSPTIYLKHYADYGPVLKREVVDRVQAYLDHVRAGGAQILQVSLEGDGTHSLT